MALPYQSSGRLLHSRAPFLTSIGKILKLATKPAHYQEIGRRINERQFNFRRGRVTIDRDSIKWHEASEIAGQALFDGRLGH